MPRRSRRTAWFRPIVELVALGLAAILQFARPVSGQDTPAPWPTGHWRVSERAFGLGSPLERLEVRKANAAGDAIVIAFERDDQGKERVWGSARLDRPAGSLGTARWLRAEWTAGPIAVVLQLRGDGDGKLVAVIRRRDRHRGAAGPEVVRQALLERDAATPQPSDAAIVLPPDSRSRRELTGPEPWRTEPVGVFLVRADGSGLQPLTMPEGFVRAAQPAWSPDGRWIAFATFDASGRDAVIRVVPAAGGPCIAVASGIAPSWSHDSSRIAYVATGRSELATDWSTPGRNDERIEALRLQGPGAGEVEILTRGIWPRWAPDDDRLAFVDRRASNWDVYLRSTDGLRLLRLTDDPALDTHPLWTADGKSLVFLSDRGNRWDLYRVAADGRNGSDPVRLTNQRHREEGADLRRQGDLIAFTEISGRRESQILLLELASGLVHPLLDPPNGDRDPAWSPDGQRIAFVSRRPGPMTKTAEPEP